MRSDDTQKIDIQIHHEPERRTDDERRADARRATLGERRLGSRRVIASLLRL